MIRRAPLDDLKRRATGGVSRLAGGGALEKRAFVFRRPGSVFQQARTVPEHRPESVSAARMAGNPVRSLNFIADKLRLRVARRKLRSQTLKQSPVTLGTGQAPAGRIGHLKRVLPLPFGHQGEP